MIYIQYKADLVRYLGAEAHAVPQIESFYHVELM